MPALNLATAVTGIISSVLAAFNAKGKAAVGADGFRAPWFFCHSGTQVTQPACADTDGERGGLLQLILI